MKIHFGHRFFVFSVLTLAWMVVIFLLSAQNGDDSSGVSGKMLAIICDLLHYQPPPRLRAVLVLVLRKGAHMTEFGVLALLWLGTLRAGFGREKWNAPAAFAAASVYAATDEIHQLFVSGRAGRATDWLIDSAGALLFLFTGWLLCRLFHTIAVKIQSYKNSNRKGS